ncbi:MAG: VCBS repeat-containing protein [Desulfuromonadales bacterium]|nr:VCBS repeat-containing protein [Desulfuromonadales bacterium]
MKKYLIGAATGLLLTLGLTTMAAAADWVDAVVQDFAPRQAVVVMQVGDEYLIDKDATAGVRVGDLFSSIRPGKSVVHPLTGEILGSLDELLGVVRVTRIKPGYSYVQAVGMPQTYAPGDNLLRFAQIPAMVTGGTAEAVRALQAALPQFEWLEETEQSSPRLQAPGLEKPLLVFVFEGGQLLVRDDQGTLRGSYPLATVAAPSVSPAALAPAAATLPTGLVPVDTGSSLSIQGVVHSPPLKGAPNGVAVADFDGDKRQEIAVGYHDKIVIMQLAGGEFTSLGEIPAPRQVKILAVDAIDLDGDGQSELYVTATRDGIMHSLRVVHRAGTYQTDITALPWMFRVVTTGGQKKLLGQPLGDTANPFSEKVVALGIGTAGLIAGSEDAGLAAGRSLYGALPIPGAPQVTALLTPSDQLRVLDAAGEVMWESAAKFGGTERNIIREKFIVGGVEYHQTPLQGAMVQYGDTLLVPQNDGSRTLSHSMEFESSRVVAMSWDGYALQEIWSTQKEAGYLSDFEVADADHDGRDEIVMAVVYSRAGFFSASRAALLVYALP